MKDVNFIATAEKNVKNLISSEQIKLIKENIFYFVLSIFISKGTLFGSYTPFGTAFLAAVPYKNMLFSLIGSIIAYILSSEIDIGIRYVSTAIAVCLIRWTLNDLHKLKENRLYAPIIAFATTIATGLAINVSITNEIDELAVYLIEAIISGGADYFFYESIKIFYKNREKLNQSELISICITIFFVILSLLSVNFGHISLGKVLAILVIIFCAKFMGIVGGSIAGTTAGVILGLAYKEPTYIMGAYAFGGLIAGLTSPFGKIACCFSFLASSLIISIQTGSPTTVISGIYDSLLASLIFIFLNNNIGNQFIDSVVMSTKYDNHEGLKDSVSMRLNFISNAMMNISESIDLVSKKLSQKGKNTEDNVMLEARNKICNSCGFNSFCFGNKNVETVEALSKINESLKKKGKISKSDFPISFIKRCKRVAELKDSINEIYKNLLEKNISEKRVSEVRNFVSEQFFDIGLLMSDIVAEIKNLDAFDLELSKKVKSELSRLGLNTINVCCRYNKYRRLTIEIDFDIEEKEKIKKLNLKRKLSKVCHKTLNLACSNAISDIFRVTLTEKPNLNIQIGIAQHICKNGMLCGDNYINFEDGLGRKMFILSDGMGTGGRAAVEGAMTCKVMENLLKSGISFSTAIKITNSILQIKSEDEFLATLDIFCLDLFSGKTKLLKAGAPFTLLKKNGEVFRFSKSSLPIGILKEVSVAEDEYKLEQGDKILMISDGAISKGDEWLELFFKSWNDENPQTFADSIIKNILNDNKDDFDDDITVVAIKIINY